MKKATKIIAATLSTVAVAGIATAVAFAWGDNAGGRKTYSIADINKGALGNTIQFNSIVDTDEKALTEAQRKAGIIVPLEDERNFVGARDASTGNHGAKNVWNGNEIVVEEGKEYLVRLYVHNNNPKGTDAIAKDVTVSFNLPTVVDTEERVDGYINSSNATPSRYWDSVVFKSSDSRKFYLDYVEGSALFENNSVGKNGGVKLADSLVNAVAASSNAANQLKSVKIGYDKLDGNIPGCYNYAGYVTIKVKPVFESSSVEKKVRIKGTKEWKASVDAKINDTVEYQIHYKNLNASTVNNVIIRDSLPTNMEYVKGTTQLFNANFPNGAHTNDETLTIDGINIGNYAVNGDGYVRFSAKVTDKSLVCGKNRLINWAKASANGYAVQDSADVYVDKECQDEPETCDGVGIYKGNKYPKGDARCEEQTEPETCDGVGIYKGNKYPKGDARCEEQTDPETCDGVGIYKGNKYPKGDARCTEQTEPETCDGVGIYAGNKYAKGDARCTEMPNTGVADLAGAALGMGSVVTAAGYYVSSRKALKK